MRIYGVGQISISTTDLDSAIEFYRDVLDIPFLFRVPGTPEMAFFDCGGTRLYVTEREGDDAELGNSVIYFKVDSASDAAAELTAKGVKLDSEPHVIHASGDYRLWMAFFKDPAGNLMAVMSEEGALTA